MKYITHLYFVIHVLYIRCGDIIQFPVLFSKFDSNITNNANEPYHDMLPVYIPTFNFCLSLPLQCFKMALDTSIYQTWLAGEELSNYFNHTFSIRQNDIIRNKEDISTAIVERGFISGPFIQINVTPYKTDTLFNIGVMNYGNINRKMIYYDGKIGLMKKFTLTELENEEVISYVSYLKKENIISKEIFAIEYNNLKNGYIYFGDINFKEKIKGKVAHCPMPLNKYIFSWACEINYIVYSNYSLQISSKEQYISFDSFSQYIFTPGETGDFILKKMLIGHEGKCELVTQLGNKFLICNKEENLQSFKSLKLISGEEFVFIIEPNDIFDLNAKGDKYISKLIANSNEESLWTIGLPGFNNKVIIFNKDDNIIGLIDLRRTKKNKLHYTIIIFLIVIVVITSLLVIIFYLRRFALRWNTNKESDINFPII